jgi:glutathione peroxidase
MKRFHQPLRKSMWIVLPILPIGLAGCPMPYDPNPGNPPVPAPPPPPTPTPAPTVAPTATPLPKPAPQMIVNQLATPKKKKMSFYNFQLKTLDGKDLDFKTLKGKTVLIVNTASKCGYTKQYAGLQALSQKYKEKGLVVIGFPSNEFGSQEPGSDSEIAQFCQKNYGVTFQMMSKVAVKGASIVPFFEYLTQTANPALKGEIGWNFEKFLISRDGKLVSRYKSAVTPESNELTSAIEAELAE